MFGLFGKKPTAEDAELFFFDEATDARIEPHYENGNYAAFMVFLECSFSEFKKHAIHQEGIGSIVKTVERRIKSGKFLDPAADIDMVQMSRQFNWQPNLSAKRIVVVDGNKPVFSWDVKGTEDDDD